MELNILCSIALFIFTLLFYSKTKKRQDKKTNEAVIIGLITYFFTSVILPPLASVSDMALCIDKNIPKIKKGIEETVSDFHIHRTINSDNIDDSNNKLKYQITELYDDRNKEKQLDVFPFHEYISFLLNEYRKNHGEFIKINCESLSVRICPDLNSDVITKISEDEEFLLINKVINEKEEIWYQIRIDDDITGYVDSNFAKII